MSKRRAILEAVNTKLLLIATASGYFYDLPANEPNYGIRSMGRLTAYPAIDYFLADEDDPQYQPSSTVESDLSLTVIGYLRTDADVDDLAIEDFLSDITKAMHSDHTLGGLVAEFKCTNRSVDPFLEGNELPRVCSLEFDITYFADFADF